MTLANDTEEASPMSEVPGTETPTPDPLPNPEPNVPEFPDHDVPQPQTPQPDDRPDKTKQRDTY